MPGKKYYFWRNIPVHEFRWAKVMLILIFAVFTARLFQLQIIRGYYYWRKAENNRLQYFYIPAPRGRIFDRNGLELAGNQPRYSLYAALKDLDYKKKEELASRINKITDFSEREILKRFQSKDVLPFGVLKLISHLTKDEIIKIEENIHNLPQVSIQVEPCRKYPFAANGAHLLGHIGQINKNELEKMKRYGYKLKDEIGKSGLEEVYDSQLRGIDGFQEIEVEVSGSQKRIVKKHEPVMGNDVLLTVDWELQKAAKDAMGDKAGAAVAMNPKTGEILVWLSQPGFNPEDFTMPLTKEKAKEIFENPKYPLFDRIIQGQYAPGSIFKLITAITALELDKGNVNREYNCIGLITVGYDKRIFRCWKDKKHGPLNLLDAIANSCNVYFYQLGMDIGAENIYKTAVKMGLGRPAQDVFLREKSGFIPTTKWKKENFGIGWYPGDTANMSVGQGFVLVNPLQILKFISAIATDGKMYAPYFIQMVISSDGKILKRNKPRMEKQVDISRNTFEKIKDGMRRVTEYGTGQFLSVSLDVAAKTGTAENPFGDDHAWYACFAPINDPEIAIVVMIENGGYGSVAAMPVAREILRKKFLN